MDRSILPFERADRRIWEGTECLYRDHLGREVVLDVEGAGTYALIAPRDATIEVDGVVTNQSEGTFAHSVLIARPAGQKAMAFAYAGPEIPFGNAISVTGRYEGCGWIVTTNGPSTADGKSDSIGSTLLFPTPFFREAFCEKGMRVLPDPTTRCDLVDHFSIADEEALVKRSWKVQNISAIVPLDSTDDLGNVIRKPVASHLNRASWRVAIPPDNKGLILHRLYDRFHGRQRARVHVDGQCIGWWYEASQDRIQRWGIADFGIPAEHTRGKADIEIAIDPPGGAPLWSVGEYSLFALLPA